MPVISVAVRMRSMPYGRRLRRPCPSPQAQQIALRNHPRIASAELAAQASDSPSRRLARLTIRRFPEMSQASAPSTVRFFGGRGDHLQHLQPAGDGGGREPTADGFRAHRQPGAERQTAQRLAESERQQYPRSGAGRGASRLIIGRSPRSPYSKSRRRHSIFAA